MIVNLVSIWTFTVALHCLPIKNDWCVITKESVTSNHLKFHNWKSTSFKLTFLLQLPNKIKPTISCFQWGYVVFANIMCSCANKL